MVWVRQEPTEKVESNAGAVQLRVAENPLVITKKTLFGRSEVEDWERRKATYDVFLTPPGSVKEEKIGYATMVHRKVGDLQATSMHDFFTRLGLKDDDRVVMIEDFFPVGKKGEQGELKEKPHLKRNRIGSAVLRTVLDECKAEGVAAAYCTTKKPAMQDFLTSEEIGFQLNGRLYAKIL
jgi:hypothetical protein